MFNLALIWGIYVLTCTATGRRYVGKCADRKGIGKRWATHRRELRAGRSPCTLLQEEWTAYGEDSFMWELVEPIEITLPDSFFALREDHWIRLLSADLNVLSPLTGHLRFGGRHSAKTKQKLKERWAANRAARVLRIIEGVAHVPYEKRLQNYERMQAARRGLPHPHKGKKLPPEWVEKLRVSHCGKVSPQRKPVEATCLKTGSIETWPSASAAAQSLGGHVSGVSAACLGGIKTYLGRTWRYVIP